MLCLKCGNENSVNAKFCRGCGNKLEGLAQVVTGSFVECSKCGQTNKSSNKFCLKCGAPVISAASISSQSVPATPPTVAPSPNQATVHPKPINEGHSRNIDLGGMDCSSCGKKLPDGAKFCKHCGTKAESIASVLSALEQIIRTLEIPVTPEALVIPEPASQPEAPFTPEPAAQPAVSTEANVNQPKAPSVITTSSVTPATLPATTKFNATTKYAVIGVIAAVLIGGLGYWGWINKKAAEEQAILVAKQQAETEAQKKAADEEKQKAAEEQLRIKAEADKATAEADEKAKQEAEEKAQKEKEELVAKMHREKEEQAAKAKKELEQQQQALQRAQQQQALHRTQQRQAQQQNNQPAPNSASPATTSTSNNKSGTMYEEKFRILGIVVAERKYPTIEMRDKAKELWKNDRSILEPDGTIKKPNSNNGSNNQTIPGMN